MSDQLTVKPCPCGDSRCSKVMVAPLFSRVEATLDREEAEDLVRRYNSQPDLLNALRTLYELRTEILNAVQASRFTGRANRVEQALNGARVAIAQAVRS